LPNINLIETQHYRLTEPDFAELAPFSSWTFSHLIAVSESYCLGVAIIELIRAGALVCRNRDEEASFSTPRRLS
jgi:hypothetical protein